MVIANLVRVLGAELELYCDGYSLTANLVRSPPWSPYYGPEGTVMLAVGCSSILWWVILLQGMISFNRC